MQKPDWHDFKKEDISVLKPCINISLIISNVTKYGSRNFSFIALATPKFWRKKLQIFTIKEVRLSKCG